MPFDAFQDTFWKYVLVVVLFAAFLGLAGLQSRWSIPRRRIRRRRRPPPSREDPGTGAPDATLQAEAGPTAEPEPLPRSRFPVGLALVAMLLCIAALAVMWYAATLAAVSGPAS